MKIQTLRDLKKALKSIPNNILEELGYAFGEGCEEKIGLCIFDEDFIEKYDKCQKKYPQLIDIDKWIQNILKAQEIMDKQDDDSNELYENMDEAISSETDFDDLLGKNNEEKKK